MLEATITDRRRGPEIAGERITVYTMLECLQQEWHPDLIAFWHHLDRDRVDAAMRFIEEHQSEVTADYRKIMERIDRGNPPELLAELDGAHNRVCPQHAIPVLLGNDAVDTVVKGRFASIRPALQAAAASLELSALLEPSHWKHGERRGSHRFVDKIGTMI